MDCSARVSAPPTQSEPKALDSWQVAFRKRHFLATYGPGVRKQHHDGQMVIPDDITVLTRDPSPCFRCGTNGGCKHRPWELGL